MAFRNLFFRLAKQEEELEAASKPQAATTKVSLKFSPELWAEIGAEASLAQQVLTHPTSTHRPGLADNSIRFEFEMTPERLEVEIEELICEETLTPTKRRREDDAPVPVTTRRRVRFSSTVEVVEIEATPVEVEEGPDLFCYEDFLPELEQFEEKLLCKEPQLEEPKQKSGPIFNVEHQVRKSTGKMSKKLWLAQLLNKTFHNDATKKFYEDTKKEKAYADEQRDEKVLARTLASIVDPKA
jgi:hypothetical protein